MEKNFFEIPDNNKRIEILEKTFSSYSNCIITKKSIIEYMEQFPKFLPNTNRNVVYESILEVLEHVDFWNWDKLQIETEKLVKKLLSRCKRDYGFCLLGNERDSSFRILQMLPLEYRQIDYSLEKVLDTKSYPKNLIFIDDGASSGNQVITIFQEWMGVSKEKRKLEKEYVRELSVEKKEKLKNCYIYLGYMNFRKSTEEYILSELKKMGIKQVEIVYLYSFSKIFESNHFESILLRNTAKECFERIGKKIMFTSHLPIENTKCDYFWTYEKLQCAGLGYSDAQQTIVYNYNVPTYTLTALWKSVDTPLIIWKPLFLRKKHVGLSH